MRGLLLLLVLLLSFPALAVNPDEMLADPKLEARARDISKDLRCLVCQNHSIDDSDALLAHDLRRIVRERLVAGDSDQQVKDYLVQRYGNYVLLTPPVNSMTALLWGGPAVMLFIAAAIVAVKLRRHAKLPDSAD